MHYPTFWKQLQDTAGLEKLAQNEDPNVARSAQILLGETCDLMFAAVKVAARTQVGTPSPVAQFTRVIEDLRQDHRATGDKFAASDEQTFNLLHKLACAALVDNVIEAQLEKLAGEEYEQARSVQLLGREYAVNLMRGLFA